MTGNREAFIEAELFHDKRTNLTLYEKHPVDFISKEFFTFIKGGHSKIRERT
jgi:hypothetical protein